MSSQILPSQKSLNSIIHSLKTHPLNCTSKGFSCNFLDLVVKQIPQGIQLHEEKLICASLTQQNGFGQAFLHNLLRLVKGTWGDNTRRDCF
jgi:hypothetical protein